MSWVALALFVGAYATDSWALWWAGVVVYVAWVVFMEPERPPSRQR